MADVENAMSISLFFNENKESLFFNYFNYDIIF